MSGNIWALFDNLLHKPSNTLATVRERNGSTYIVELNNGQMVDVVSVGNFDVDSRVFVGNGEIVGNAPNLQFFEFEV